MQKLILEPGRAAKQYWRDLWRYRELFYFLAWRDILVRYKQTVVGVAWAVIQPFLTTVVFTIIFSRVAKLPHPIMSLMHCSLWPPNFRGNFFLVRVGVGSSNSLIGNANLISKVYFPRLIVPAGSVITSFVDFLTTGLMALMMVWYRFAPTGGFSNPAFIRGFVLRRLVRSWALAQRTKRRIPRFSIHHSVHRAAWTLRFPRWIQQLRGAGKMAAALFA